jgi:putative transposase
MRRVAEQLELDRVRHGGRRPGAGRKPGPDPRVRHRSRDAFGHRAPCHVTLKVREGVPSLRTVRLVRELERSFAAGCERNDFRLVHYSINGNHAHLIVEADNESALGRGMKALGSRLARAVNRIFRRSGPVLAGRPPSPAHTAHAARSAKRACLRPLECAQARRASRPCALARVRDRSRLLRALVRWLAAPTRRGGSGASPSDG